MRWLIPFVQATGYRIVIDNPKSRKQIIIDQNTTKFPHLSSKWLKCYNKKELAAWMKQEKAMKKARRNDEAHGRAKFGNSYQVFDQDIP